MSYGNYNFIFAAGGTGGHLYPAIAVAEQLKVISPQSKILFVGTKKKIESNVIPKLGYNFKTIWISGFSRKLTINNLLFPLKLIVSLIQSFTIIFNFKPNVAIGAGAYVSGPVAWMASLFGAKIVLLEQNSFPGVTNRMLENKAASIHLSFENSAQYFKNKSKLKMTGNPVRTTLNLINKKEAINNFGFDADKKVLFVMGGSLGARVINKSVEQNIEIFIKNKIQLIWQTGELYYDEYKNMENEFIRIYPFISEMDKAFSACDLLVARAGATTIAEAAYLGLPVIFIPSTNVAANHQFKNAKSLVDNNAGLMIEDSKLKLDFGKMILETITDQKLLLTLISNIKKFSKPEAAHDIAMDVLKLAEQNKK